MPKAILELPEMPESCWECVCVEDVGGLGIEYKCGVTNEYCPEEGRCPDCPLKLVEGKEVEP